MKIKKAIYHESYLDSPRLAPKDKLNPIQASTLIKNTDLQYNQISQSIHYQNKKSKIKNTQSYQQNRIHAANLLTKILKRNMAKSSEDKKKKTLFKSQIISPQQVVNLQKKAMIQKNCSQMIESYQRKSNKHLLQKIRSQANDPYYKRLNTEIQMQKSTRNLQNLLKQQRNDNIIELNKNNMFLIQTTTIKQRIQKYLAQEQQKRLQHKNMHLCRQNHKLANQNKVFSQSKGVGQTKNINQNINANSKLENQNFRIQIGLVNFKKSNQKIFSSLSSLIRKKQSKHMFEMMKRRLNFSSVTKPSPNNHKDICQQSSLQRKDSLQITTKKISQQQLSLQKTSSQNRINNKKLISQDHQALIQNKIMYQIQRNPQLLKKIQDEIKRFGTSFILQKFINHIIEQGRFSFKKSFGNNLKKDKGLIENKLKIKLNKSQQLLVNADKQEQYENIKPIDQKEQQVGNQQMKHNQTDMERSTTTVKQQNNDKQKQYQYTLYYYSPQQIKKQRQQLKQNKQIKKQSYLINKRQKSQDNIRYKQWKKQSQVQLRLKNLLKFQSDLIDPLSYYNNAFEQKKSPYYLNTYMPLNQKPSFLSQSPSQSQNLKNKKPPPVWKLIDTSKQRSTELPKKNHYIPTITSQKSDEQIIFVSKKQKQNLKQKKMSNLLYKIQKRNSQIQRIGHVQVLEALREDKKGPNNIKKQISEALNKKLQKKEQNQVFIVTLYNNKRYSQNQQKLNQRQHNFINKSMQKKQYLKNKASPSNQWNYFQPWNIKSKNSTYQQQLSLQKQTK